MCSSRGSSPGVSSAQQIPRTVWSQKRLLWFRIQFMLPHCFIFKWQSFIRPVLNLKQTDTSCSLTPHTAHFSYLEDVFWFYSDLHDASFRSPAHLLAFHSTLSGLGKHVPESFYIKPRLSGRSSYGLVEPSRLSPFTRLLSVQISWIRIRWLWRTEQYRGVFVVAENLATWMYLESVAAYKPSIQTAFIQIASMNKNHHLISIPSLWNKL